MPHPRDSLYLEDEALLAQCDTHTYKSSGPGGQHRNKVSSAVRLHHRPSGLSAHGDDSRSQHDNKRLALKRLRMNLALRLREPIAPADPPPPIVAQCLFTPKVGTGQRLQIGRKDHRFWMVAAWLLDVLEACEGRLADAAARAGISTGNFTSILQDDRHLLAGAQEIRKRFGHRPIA